MIFTGYATAAEPSIGVVGVVSVVSGVCVVVTDVQLRLDSFLSVMSRESFRHVIYLVSWLRRAFRVHESSPRVILTCNLQGFVAPEGVSSAPEQPEVTVVMYVAGSCGSVGGGGFGGTFTQG